MTNLESIDYTLNKGEKICMYYIKYITLEMFNCMCAKMMCTCMGLIHHNTL